MKRRDFIKYLGVGAAGLATGFNTLSNADVFKGSPNFILLLSDDQNWDGLSIQMDPLLNKSKSAIVETPHIANLAMQGMRFSQAYAPAPVCSPTRASLLTGMTPAKLQWTKAGPNVDVKAGYKLIPGQSRRMLPGSISTIAKLLKTRGYVSAHYGKWHLGSGGPETFGYDDSDGSTDNRDAAPFGPPNPVDIFGMTERAERFMQNAVKDSKSFFIQMSYHALHYPQNALPETISKYQGKMPNANMREIRQAAMAENLDTGIGQLLDKLNHLGISENTYVIYMSDNGGGGKGKNRVLRGGKGSLFEGGIRIPFIIRGPGISQDTVCSTPIAGYDLPSTFCNLAGVEQSLFKDLEGGNISPLFWQKDDTVWRKNKGLVFHFPHYQTSPPQSAIRDGKYKLLYSWEDEEGYLYNLDTDPGEREDVSKQFPDIKKALYDRLMNYLSSVNAAIPELNSYYNPEFTFEDHQAFEKQNRPQIKKRKRK